MTYREAWEWTRKVLLEIYPEQESLAIAREVFLRLLHLSPDQRVLKAHEPMSSESTLLITHALEDLKTGKPVQYVTGVCEFLGMELKVEPGVLIPRPETEELVLWAEKELKARFQTTQPSVIDVGTGSGCIAIALAKRLSDARISACDVSLKALQVASHNITKHQVQVNLFLCNILDEATVVDHFLKDSHDCIISNPPYVRYSEMKWMKPNVLDFEPKQALFVDDTNPLLYYRSIGELALRSLKPGGILLFEINENLSQETAEMLHQLGYTNIEIRLDLFGKPRFIKAQNRDNF